MKKIFKGMGALALAGTMFLSMGTGVHAEALSGGKASADGGMTSVTFTVKLETEDNTPKTAFTYTIANGTAVDATATTPKIEAGVTDGAKFADAAAGKASFVVNDTEKTKTLTITLDPSKFGAAGIYRYTLTQTALSTAQTAIGITADEHEVKYLDLYVEGAGDAKKITNVILSNSNAAPTITPKADPEKDEAAYGTNKVDGFVNKFGKEDPDDPVDPSNPDGPKKVKNYEITLSKTVDGDLGDKDNPFEFTLNVKNTISDADTDLNGLTVNYTSTTGYDGAANAAASGTLTVQDAAYTVKLKHGETLVLKGVPSTIEIDLKENVAAAEGYKITSVVTDLKDKTEANVAAGSADTTGSKGTVDGKDGSIQYTNTRKAVSPTGVVVRFAPYILMAGGAVILLLANKRQKEHEA